MKRLLIILLFQALAFGATQSRGPTSNGAEQGMAASAGNAWECVSDKSDATYIYASEIANAIFGFTAFNMNASAIESVAVTIRAQDAGSGPFLYDRIRIGSTSYSLNSPTSITNAPSWGDFTFTWEQNPATSSAWTVDDVKGTGDNPLVAIGARVSASSVEYKISDIYAVVTYTEASTGERKKFLLTLGSGK